MYTAYIYLIVIWRASKQVCFDAHKVLAPETVQDQGIAATAWLLKAKRRPSPG
jgi:hypothetical protein